MDNSQYQPEMDFAISLARQAGAIIKQYFAQPMSFERKSDDSPVTMIDKQINQLVIDQIEAQFPGDFILAEEGSRESDSNRFWVCDPIDGTNSFIIGCPTALFSLAFVVDGESQIAVVCDPYLDRLYSASLGGGAFMNGQPLQVSSRPASEAMAGASSNLVEAFDLKDFYVDAAKLGIRHYPYGGVVHQMMNVALGRLDARIYNGPMAHDVAAASLIVTEAGGKATDRDGKQLKLDGRINGAVVSNGLFHDEIVDLIQKHDVPSKTIRGPKPKAA